MLPPPARGELEHVLAEPYTEMAQEHRDVERLKRQQRQREEITRVLARSWTFSTSGQTPPPLLARLPPDDRAELERILAEPGPAG